MSAKSIVIIVAALLIITVGGVVGFSQMSNHSKSQAFERTGEDRKGHKSASSNPKPTRKTYLNTQLGFRLQIPPEWRVRRENSNKVSFSTCPPRDDLLEQACIGSLHIYKLQSSTKESFANNVAKDYGENIEVQFVREFEASTGSRLVAFLVKNSEDPPVGEEPHVEYFVYENGKKRAYRIEWIPHTKKEISPIEESLRTIHIQS